MTDFVEFGARPRYVAPLSCADCRWGHFQPYCQYDDEVAQHRKTIGECWLNPPDVAGHRPPVHIDSNCCSHHSELGKDPR